MKTPILITSLLLGTVTFAAEADSTGLEGDHLDLSAVLEIFKNSESPEDFEKKLNTESSNVNNLDLNGDGEVDYIRVVDSGDSISHVLTLQVPVNESESQDVATIELEETDEDVVEIQIVGDEELYGENYVLLPESAGRGPVVINVITWRPVRFMWGPRYTPWVSPWRFRAYPKWYRPWKRRSWRVYRGHVIVYHGGCRRVHRRSFTHGHVHHYHRTSSVTFHTVHHHKHTGKTATGTKSSGKTVKTSTKSQNAASKPVTQTSTKQEVSPNKSTTKSSTTANTKKVTTTHNSSPANQKNTQQKSTNKKSTKSKSATPSSRKRPGTKNSGTRTRSSGGGKRK